MCHFLSVLVLRDGSVRHHPMLDSHGDLVHYFKLPDENPHIPYFAKAELTPTTDWTDASTWAWRIDEAVNPVWLTPDVEKAAEEATRAIAQRMVIKDGEHRLIVDGCWIIAGAAKIRDVRSGRIVRVQDLATISNVWGSATISNVRGSATIRDVGGLATIRDVGGSATISNVWGSATISNVRDLATIRDVGGLATIRDVGGLATISNVRDSATISDVRDSATISNVRGSATIRDVGGSATISNVWGSATIRDVGGSATIGNVWGSAELDASAEKAVR